MQILTPGHKYELANFEDKKKAPQRIQFIEKESVGNKLQTVHDGTTNEEVLAVLIDRLRYLGNKLPSRENAIALTKCEEALLWLNKRTADRQERGVEGTHKA